MTMPFGPNWLLLHAGALGDLVLAVQLLLRMPAARRAERIEVLSRADLGELTACNPSIVRRSIEGIGSHWLFAAEPDSPPSALASAIEGRNVVGLLAERESGVHARLAQLSPARLFSVDPRPRPGDRAHIVDQWQAELERQGAVFESCVRKRAAAAQIGVPESLRSRGRELLRAVMDVRIEPVLIHPGSGSPRKNWPLAGFLAVADRLRGLSIPVCFLVGEVEQERWSDSDVARLRETSPVIVTPTAADLAAILSTGGLLIGNDSGPSHLAALLGTPTLTLFGPTDPALWRPLGPQATFLRGPQPEIEGWGLTIDRVHGAAVDAFGLT